MKPTCSPTHFIQTFPESASVAHADLLFYIQDITQREFEDIS